MLLSLPSPASPTGSLPTNRLRSTEAPNMQANHPRGSCWQSQHFLWDVLAACGSSHCLTPSSTCLWSCSAFPELLTPLTKSSCLSVLTPASLSTTKDWGPYSPLTVLCWLLYPALLNAFLPSPPISALSSLILLPSTIWQTEVVSQDCILSPGFDSLHISHYLLPSPRENSWQPALKQTGAEKTPWSQRPGFHLWYQWHRSYAPILHPLNATKVKHSPLMFIPIHFIVRSSILTQKNTRFPAVTSQTHYKSVI